MISIIHINRFVVFEVLLFSVTLGCSDKVQPQASLTKSSWKSSISEHARIVPGVGIDEIKCGMSAQAIEQWKKPSGVTHSEAYRNTTWLKYEDDGIEVSCRNGNVKGVCFSFLSRTSKPFRGETQDGIGSTSSFRDVICKYGKPECIFESIVDRHGTWPGAQEVRVYYPTKGIEFIFINDHLAAIKVFIPNENIGPDMLSDMGDTAELRKIKCDD